MTRLVLIQWLLYANSIAAFSIPNVNATYSSSPKPFLIEVSPEFINFTLDRVATSRFPIDVQQPDWTDGPPNSVANAVRDYWVSNYSWTDVQMKLNQRFKMFTTVVPATNKPRYDAHVPLHFVHHHSPRSDAIPLLFMHGWPGNFLEVTNIIDGLTDPPSKDIPAFHVVAPSLPGFGFSPAPTKPGMGSEAAGDLGGFISRWLAHNHPESVVSMLSNFWLSPPNNRDMERYALGLSTADEQFVIQEYASRVASDTGFSTEQQTQPLQLAYGMSDSPMGLAMWLYDVMHAVVQHYVFPMEQIITWTHMYWIQGPLGGFRFYKENQQDGVINNGLSDLLQFPFVQQPVAISQFPLDFWYRTPIDWAQRTGNVVRRTVHDSGGHFAAVESPETLLADIRSFFGNKTLSHTYVFGH